MHDSRYFQALHNGDVPPIKARLEQDLPSREERLGGLTKGCLAVLHSQVYMSSIEYVLVAVVTCSYTLVLYQRRYDIRAPFLLLKSYSMYKFKWERGREM